MTPGQTRTSMSSLSGSQKAKISADIASEAAAFADRAEKFINEAWDRGLTVYVSRPLGAAKIKARDAVDRTKVLRRSGDGALLFGFGARVWRLSVADHLAARN